MLITSIKACVRLLSNCYLVACVVCWNIVNIEQPGLSVPSPRVALWLLIMILRHIHTVSQLHMLIKCLAYLPLFRFFHCWEWAHGVTDHRQYTTDRITGHSTQTKGWWALCRCQMSKYGQNKSVKTVWTGVKVIWWFSVNVFTSLLTFEL